MMDFSFGQASNVPRQPHVLLAACEGDDAAKFGSVCDYFTEWAEVKAVVTTSSYRLIPRRTIPRDVRVYNDNDEWETWRGKYTVDHVEVHTELSNWADIMVIAPLSANTLANIVGGLCNNLLTCIVRSWDEGKPLFVAPSMSSSMWKNPTTEQHCKIFTELGITLIPPSPYLTPSGECEHVAMSEPSNIHATVKNYWEKNAQSVKNLVQ